MAALAHNAGRVGRWQVSVQPKEKSLQRLMQWCKQVQSAQTMAKATMHNKEQCGGVSALANRRQQEGSAVHCQGQPQGHRVECATLNPRYACCCWRPAVQLAGAAGVREGQPGATAARV